MSDLYTLLNSGSAFGGQAIVAKVTGTGASGSLANYTLAVTESANYNLWVRVLAHEPGLKFYAGVQSLGTSEITVPTEGEWVWVHCGQYLISAGLKDILIGPKDVGVYVDAIVLTELSLTPGQIDTRLGGAPIGTLPPAGSGGGSSTSVFDLSINPSFSDSDRRLKDDTPFTSLMNRIYDGILGYYVGGSFLETASEKEIAVERMLREGYSYGVGRHAFQQYQCLMMLFRMTGDRRLLDELTRLSRVARLQGMRTSWLPDSGAWPGSGKSWAREPHEVPMFMSNLGDASQPHYGNDDHLSDTIRALRPFVNLAVALRQNAGAVSPAGYSYASEASAWETIFEGYERIWSGNTDSTFPSGAKVEDNYNGRFNIPYGPNYHRAAWEEWPVNFRGGTHTSHGSALLHMYLGRVRGKVQLGHDALRWLMTRFLLDEILYGTFGGREHAFWPRDYSQWEDGSVYSHPGVYAGYSMLDFTDLYLDGEMNDDAGVDFPRLLRGAANSVSYWMAVGSSATDFIMKGDMQGKVDRTGTTINGATRTLAGTGPSEFVDRPRQIASFWAVGIMIPWAQDGGKIRDWFSRSMFDYRSGDGTWDTPRVLPVPVGVFMDESGLFG